MRRYFINWRGVYYKGTGIFLFIKPITYISVLLITFALLQTKDIKFAITLAEKLWLACIVSFPIIMIPFYLEISGKAIPLKKRVKELTVFINENPHDSALFYERGNLYRRLGKYYEAREDYDKALEIDPNNAEIYIQRGWLFSYAYRDRLKAIEDLTHAIAVDPVSITAYKKRAISYEVMGHTNLAIADLEHILQIDPSAIGSHWRIANILFESNRIEEAIERMHRFIKAGGDKEEAQEIITDFQKELEKKPLYRRLWQFLRRWIPW